MKRIIISTAAVFILTAVILITIWSAPAKEDETVISSADTVASPESRNEESSDEVQSKCETGSLFLPYAEIIDSGVYKLVITRQKRFGGNSVPVKTTTYYGDGFINIIEEEGHGIASETFINEDGVYCFDATTGKACFMPELEVSTDKIVTESISLIETGEADVGISSFTYERYKTENGDIIDYLFAGEELKKMKLYDGEDYELISVEIYKDISGARTSVSEDGTVQ